MSSEDGTAMSITKEGDKYVKHEFSADDIKNKKLFLEEIQEFIKSSTEIVSSYAILGLEKDKYEELCKVIGSSSINSTLAAKENDALLYSDDSLSRVLVDHEWGVKGIWTQTILKIMLEKNVITNDEYHKAVTTLALANYAFVSITADDIMWFLESNNMTINDAVEKLFKLLKGPDCSEESALIVLVNLVKKVWLEVGIEAQKINILDLSLKVLTEGREGHKIIKMFRSGLKINFRLLPIHFDQILKHINIWTKQKIL